LYVILIVLVILHFVYLINHNHVLIALLYLIPLIVLWINKKFAIIAGFIPSIVVLLNPHRASSISYFDGALLSWIESIINYDPTTFYHSLSISFWPILILGLGIYCLLKNKKSEKVKE
jgi:hypothetical protein